MHCLISVRSKKIANMTKSRISLHLFLITVSTTFFAACQANLSGNYEIANGQNKVSNECSAANKSLTNTAGDAASDGAFGEIKECNPQKLSGGDVLKIRLAVPNGGNLAIVRDKNKDGFFLLSDEKRIETKRAGEPFLDDRQATEDRANRN